MKELVVLIVKDDPDTQELMIGFLDHLGCTGYLATNGLEALSMAEQIKPDVILLDLMMPRLDGLGFLKRRAENDRLKNTPTLVVSAVGTAEKVKEAVALGASGYMKKPISLQALEEKLKQIRSASAVGAAR